MIRPFKFLSGEKSMLDMYGREINPNHYRTISLTRNLRFLKEYHRRLVYLYTSHYNIYGGDNPLRRPSIDLYSRTVGFINEGQLTTHNEIRRYVHNTYSDLVYGVFDRYEIDDTRNQEIIFDTYGQVSREAIQYLNDYSNRVTRYEMTTTIATYKVADIVYGEGNIVAGTVNAYPLDASNIRISFKIRNQEITEHRIEIDYQIENEEQYRNELNRMYP